MAKVVSFHKKTPCSRIQQGMGTGLSAELGNEGGEEEEWHPTSVTPLPVQASSPAAISPKRPLANMDSLMFKFHAIIWNQTITTTIGFWL